MIGRGLHNLNGLAINYNHETQKLINLTDCLIDK